MHSPEVLARIREDMRLGSRPDVGVSSTPAVFLNGRLLDRYMRDLLAFWKVRAEALKRSWEDKW
jgi:hypothetical protein